MLEFFRKYQKGFFFVVAFLVIASTVFYGVGNVMNGAPEREVSEEERLAAELVEEGREKKITVIHYRQKSRHFKKAGHRQPYATVRITALP